MLHNIITKFANKIHKINAMSYNNDVKLIYNAALESVKSENLIKSSVKCENNNLVVNNDSFLLRKPCYLVGFGKAVLGMALEMERILGEQLEEAIVTIPTGMNRQSAIHSKICFIEGAAGNLPDSEALNGAQQIKNLCEKLACDDLLIVLVSGGGSALLPLPEAGIELDEKLWLIKELASRGADIFELNSVRKRISQLKGGGLAEFARPARVVALILSDVIGDALDFIASGPTVKNQDEPGQALRILEKYGIVGETPASITRVLKLDDEIKRSDYTHVNNFLIGNNKLACSAAKRRAQELGYQSAILSTKISGDVNRVAEMYAELAARINDNPAAILSKYGIVAEELMMLKNKNRSVCVIGGGEPTVVVTGNGIGGRNQQLALIFSREIERVAAAQQVTFLSCGTDGIDGPSDAAGAIGCCGLYPDARDAGFNPDEYLNNNDCFNFFKNYRNGGNLVVTGHTGTNVSDIHVMIIN